MRDAILAKAHFIRRTIGDKEEAIKIYQEALKKTIEIGKKMDINLEILRIYLESKQIGTWVLIQRRQNKSLLSVRPFLRREATGSAKTSLKCTRQCTF